MIGKRVGHYRILEKIGAGGMGEVYRARDEQLDRDVALKVLPASNFRDSTARARLLREARTASQLNHPYICTIHEVGEAEGQAYIAMELVQGRALSALIPAAGLPAEQVLRHGVQLAEALAHAHERGVVHRDLKSANVVITPEGRAKVLDFGLAKRLSGEELAEATTQSQASLTQPGALLGTLPYMAPEHLRGQAADARTDVWALGVVLYEMAAGRRPFRGDTGYDLSAAILREPPPSLPAKVPVELRAVIEHCLEKEPARRYQRGGEVRAALEAIQTGAVAPWATWRYRLSRSFGRRPWLALAATTVVLVAVLAALDAGGLRTRFLGGAPRIESLAVLPLKNLSGDPEQAYFVEGMHEALTAELSKISALKVISRTSAMRYKNTDKAMPQIARELGVEALIEGSVLREGDQVRITVQLIHGPTDRHLWAQGFDRDLRGVLVLQSEVARAIADEIRVKLTPREQMRLARARPVSPAAHEAYLRARYNMYKWGDEDLKKAIQYYQQAIAIEPTYALPYAGLADCYANLSFLSPKEAYPKAKAAAIKALELDDTLAWAHASVGLMKLWFEWDWIGPEGDFKRALELDPNSVDALGSYAVYLNYTGRFEESFAALKQVIELDPLTPSNSAQLAWAYMRARRYDQSIAEFKKSPEPVHLPLAINYVKKGMYLEAIPEYEKALERSASADYSPLFLGYLGWVSGTLGKPAEARKAVSRLKASSKQQWVSPYWIAIIYAGLGEKDHAFRWLNTGYGERSGGMVLLKVDPVLDSLRSDPRFQDLLRRMNFPE